MKVVAVNTIHGGKVVKGKPVEIIAKPQQEFDTVEFGIADDEALALIKRGVIKRKMREVTEADEVNAGAALGTAGAPQA